MLCYEERCFLVKSLIKIVPLIGKRVMDDIYVSWVLLGSLKTTSVNTNYRGSLSVPFWKSRVYETVRKSEYFVKKQLALLTKADLALDLWQGPSPAVSPCSALRPPWEVCLGTRTLPHSCGAWCARGTGDDHGPGPACLLRTEP